MVPKWFIYFCLTIGSIAGAYVPLLWGAGMFSFSSILFSAIGAFLGIWVAFKIGNSL